ncbi:amidohydrolase family protein [Providencia rettgeri]|uniref:N-acetylglucosamine-6-phosphate deacetylase n=1 Tax=Providencia TaxID=586 RepID=UPI00065E5228|nr:MULTISPECIES: amidohydrolase family protein [Providencia]APC10843.1 N-acetylglucosamine-6-phosphate deacetylase [Providencia rettgeri]AVL74406.1 N-acetylglucosamine-6-phosphate deacetylase [Providencia rettgeri]EJD6043073.1 amidohydrolase family protein [Providencia rettgeri]EJD6499920.1 amidohydrolase family protein [Providencia rettgeri]EJD6643265.1 amidohydrolase family protein [Providencia rettgeri]
MTITDGLFDIQVNGFAGIDFNDKNITAEAVDYALEAMLKTGVTSCLPTLITASASVLTERFQALDKAVSTSRLGELMVPGYHLEGPFINPKCGYAGCHPPSDIIKPDIQLVANLESMLTRPILLVTYAPEFDQNFQFAKQLVNTGKCVAVGHSNINFSQMDEAAKIGICMSTHLGNGIPQQLHKLDNTLQAQLSCDAIGASFIADGIHIPFPALKNLLRAKTITRSILVTDAVSAAGSVKAGNYQFASMSIERTEDGTVRVPGEANLAGSSLTLDQAIRNVVHNQIVSFDDAIRMATVNPRHYLQPAFAFHGITSPITTITWDEQLNVIHSVINEELVYE